MWSRYDDDCGLINVDLTWSSDQLKSGSFFIGRFISNMALERKMGQQKLPRKSS